MNLQDTLTFKVREWGARQPNKPAVIAGDDSISWQELVRMMDSCAHSLAESGITRGDFVAISAVMRPEYIAAFLAAKELRAVAVPMSRNSSLPEAQDIIARTHAKLFLTDNPAYKPIAITRSLRDSCRAEPKAPITDPLIPDDELTEILFTSGTTGRPKGVMLSQKAIAASIVNTSTGIDMRSSDVLLLPIPLNHSFGLRVMRSALSLGETLVLQNGFSFARETQRNIQTHGCTCIAMVNAGFELLRSQVGESWPELFRGMRYIEFSAGNVPVNTRRELRDSLPGVRLHNTWGSSETGGGLFIEFSSCDDERLKSAGHPINDIQARVIDGRLAVSGSAVLSGYYDDPELTAEVIHDGWFITNDIARIDAEGWVYLNGRIDDIISVGGEKVSPADIERIVSELGGIHECSCVGVDDAVTGQRPALFIAGDYDVKAIEEAIRTKGNAYMIPSCYVKVERLPRNEAGKVDRKKLREILRKQKSPETESLADEFLKVIMTRRSIRTFTDCPVEEAKLEKVLLAGRMAPSGHNMQTWRFTVVRKAETIARIRELAKSVSSRKRTLFYGFNNPGVIIIASNDRRNPDGIQDTSAAIENILLAAHVLGLGACWINALRFIGDEPEVREMLSGLGLPDSHVVYGVVGLGYPDGNVKVPVKKENVIHFAD